jgi:putative endonuclease
MIESSNGALYTGITTNVARRLHEHQHSKKGARFFRSHSAVAVRYQEPAISRSQALQREAFIKKLTRVQKWQLIHSQAATSIK